MNPPPGATMTAVPLGCSGLNTMIVGSVTSVTRPGCAPPKDWINFVVASDFGFIALGYEPRFLRQKTVQRVQNHFQIGARLRVVKAEQHLSLANVLAFANEDVLNDAALKMLHDLTSALVGH